MTRTKPGRTPWTVKLTGAQLRRLYECIDSGEGLMAAAIHRKLGLRRYIALRSFRDFAGRRRRDLARRLNSLRGVSGPDAGVTRTVVSIDPGGDAGARSPLRTAEVLRMCEEMIAVVHGNLVDGLIKGYAAGDALRGTAALLAEMRELKKAAGEG